MDGETLPPVPVLPPFAALLALLLGLLMVGLALFICIKTPVDDGRYGSCNQSDTPRE
jgi:hypothetical protein